MLYVDMRPGGVIVLRREGRPTFAVTYGEMPQMVGRSMDLRAPGEAEAIGRVTRIRCRGGNGVGHGLKRFGVYAPGWSIDYGGARPRRAAS